MAAWLGLMSGTSMDSVDAVLVSFRDGQVEMHGSHAQAYPTDLRQRLLLASQNQATPDDLGELDTRVGQLFASAAQAVIAKAGLAPEQIRAIGSHGQTLRHQPTGSAPFSLQIGNPAIIAEACGILTVADFRRRDVAAGGQGAPLVPAFHQAFFGSRSENRCILNLGGIANITWLPADVHATVFGFDTGPANALLDAWCQHQTGRAYDADGHWAAEGTVDEALLEDMLSDAYFDRPAPKSTGKERFNLDWLKTVLTRHPGLAPEDVQRTLLELTAQSIARQLPEPGADTVYVCGGGTRNPLLMAALARALAPARLASTEALGLAPEWVEPVAFAWLAKQAVEGKPGNLPEVTGARGPRILGALYPA